MPKRESEIRIPDEVVLTAVERYHQQPAIDDENSAHQQMSYALQAGLAAWGAMGQMRGGKSAPEHRVVTRWLPVEADHAE